MLCAATAKCRIPFVVISVPLTKTGLPLSIELRDSLVHAHNNRSYHNYRNRTHRLQQ